MRMAKYMAYDPGVMQRLDAIHQRAIIGLIGLSLAAFASSSKLFGQRHCGGKMNGRRAWGMGPEQPKLDYT